jgi:metal-sulfur cluster biosynthetic enzyme
MPAEKQMADIDGSPLDPLRDALRRVVDPCSIATGVPVDLLDMGLVKDLRLDGGTAHVELLVTSPLCTQIGLIIERVQEVLEDVDGVGSVEVTVDARAEWSPGMMSAPARERLRAVRPL